MKVVLLVLICSTDLSESMLESESESEEEDTTDSESSSSDEDSTAEDGHSPVEADEGCCNGIHETTLQPLS